MSEKRYGLSAAQWGKIASLLPDKASDPGRTGSDNRLFVNKCLSVLRSGALWQVEDGPSPFQPLVSRGRMGAGIRDAERRSGQYIFDARQHHRSGSPTGGERKKRGG